MARLAALVIVSLLMAESRSGQEAEAAAEKAARRWLDIVDNGKYEKSWDEASELFRQNMARFGKDVSFWVESLGVSRAPLGEVRTRNAVGIDLDPDTSGTPVGDLVQVEFRSAFANETGVTEKLAMIREDDGLWRVANYIIKTGS